MRLVAFTLTLFSLPALAAPPTTTTSSTTPAPNQIDTLADQLARMRSELPAAVDALHTLENRVEALRLEVERLSAVHEAAPSVQKAIDELRAELDALERRVSGNSQRVSELGSGSDSRFKFGYDDGLYMKTAPVTVLLNLAVMPRWYGIIRDGRSNDSNFELHHAQLQLRAGILDFIDVQLMLDFGAEFLGDGNLGFLRDAFVDVRPLAWLTLRAGQFQVPFSHQRLVNDFRQTFAERTLATRAFTFDRDLGGEVEVALWARRLVIQAAVTDGVRAGETAKNDNLDFAYTARILAQPLGAMPLVEGDLERTPSPRFSLGAAMQFNLVPNDLKVDLNHDGVIDNIEVYTVGGEGAFKWRGFAVEAEYFFHYEVAGAGLPRRYYNGVYGQASAMLWRGLQIGARFSWAQPPTLGGVKLGIFGDQPFKAWEAGGTVSYHLWRDQVRVQVAYDYRHDTTAVTFLAEKGQVVQVQLQAGF